MQNSAVQFPLIKCHTACPRDFQKHLKTFYCCSCNRFATSRLFSAKHLAKCGNADEKEKDKQ